MGNSNTLAIWYEGLTHLKRPWCWERLRAGGGGNRGWAGWMASSTQWTWVWANSGRELKTGKPGVLQFMGSQRVRHDLANEKQQQARKVFLLLLVSCLSFPVLSCLLCIQRGEWMIYHWSFISFEHTTVNLFSQTSNLHKWLQNEPYSETQTETFVSALILHLSVP